jgi:reverse gyrase
MRIEEFFRKATGHTPYPYQVELATGDTWYERLSIPTGVGKTAAAVLCWLFRRREQKKTFMAEHTDLVVSEWLPDVVHWALSVQKGIF